MKEDELVIRIRENQSVQIDIRENGTVTTKQVTPGVLVECIRSSLKPIAVSTGLLPAHVVAVKIDEKNTRYVIIEYPYERADVTYHTTTYTDFPLPRLIYGFCVEKSGRISQVNVGVPALGKLTPDTPMYFYPFSNVTRFSMCTGANALPMMPSLQGLTNMPQYILSLPDNDDLFDSRHNRLELGHRDLMEHLADKDRAYYYEHILVPMPNTKLKDFL